MQVLTLHTITLARAFKYTMSTGYMNKDILKYT